MCWRTRTFTRWARLHRHLDAVHGGALAHVRALARVEGVDVRPARLALRPAPLRRVGDAARDGVRERDHEPQAPGLVGDVAPRRPRRGPARRRRRDGGRPSPGRCASRSSRRWRSCRSGATARPARGGGGARLAAAGRRAAAARGAGRRPRPRAEASSTRPLGVGNRQVGELDHRLLRDRHGALGGQRREVLADARPLQHRREQLGVALVELGLRRSPSPGRAGGRSPCSAAPPPSARRP